VVSRTGLAALYGPGCLLSQGCYPDLLGEAGTQSLPLPVDAQAHPASRNRVCVVAQLSSDTGLHQRRSCVHQSPLCILFKEKRLKSLQATEQPSPTSPEQLWMFSSHPGSSEGAVLSESTGKEGAVGRCGRAAKLWHPLLEASLDLYLVGNGDRTLFPPSATRI